MRIRSRGEDIRRFILENVEKAGTDISKITGEKFAITRQGVNKHLKRLQAEGALTPSGQTRNRSYKLAPLSEWRKFYQLKPGLAEDEVWRQDIVPVIGVLPENIKDIWHYAFTEMFNNAIEHSGGAEIKVWIKKTAVDTEIYIHDDGMGIFKKIQNALNLLDERHAVLELHKGKLTTDPKHHTGEGIFFTSRMVDSFNILSGGVLFNHEFNKPEDWIFEGGSHSGTFIIMKLNNHSSRTSKKVFDQYTSGDDIGFTKTVVPVRLAQYGNDKLISRSQARRILSRVELFKTVIFDFSEVSTIGQAFADEIFRVFSIEHPEIRLLSVNESEEVKQMIQRARTNKME